MSQELIDLVQADEILAKCIWWSDYSWAKLSSARAYIRGQIIGALKAEAFAQSPDAFAWKFRP